MWLSRPIYEGLPYGYFAAGVIGLLAALYLERGYWPETCALIGACSMVAGLVLWLKRRGHRATLSRLRSEEHSPL